MAALGLAKSSLWEATVDDIVAASGLTQEDASGLYEEMQRVATAHPREGSEAEIWRAIVGKGLLSPNLPHQLHQLVYYTVYGKWDVSVRGPPPYWFPSR